MAFTLDATVGGASSNSYLTVEEADDYFDGRYGSDLYTSLQTASKQQLLASATKRIDAEKYAGIKNEQNLQRLQWPRNLVYDRDGYPYENQAMPFNLKNAVCELLYFYLQADDRNLDELETFDARNLSEFSIGPLSYKFNSWAKMDTLPDTVKNELVAIGLGAWLGETGPTQLFR